MKKAFIFPFIAGWWKVAEFILHRIRVFFPRAKSIFYALVQASQHPGMVFGGYFRILPHLSTALRMRRQHPDCLAETDLSQFTERRASPDRQVG